MLLRVRSAITEQSEFVDVIAYFLTDDSLAADLPNFLEERSTRSPARGKVFPHKSLDELAKGYGCGVKVIMKQLCGLLELAGEV